jgi:hypothetical protein
MEVVAVDEGLGDVEGQRGASLGDHEIEVVRNEEGIDGEDGDLVELRPGEVAQEDVVAEDIGKGAGSCRRWFSEGREREERGDRKIKQNNKKMSRICYTKL